jgi:hypothetical protein
LRHFARITENNMSSNRSTVNVTLPDPELTLQSHVPQIESILPEGIPDPFSASKSVLRLKRYEVGNRRFSAYHKLSERYDAN